MQIYKYTTVESIIENVYINAGYQQINWNEALEHIGRVVSYLGIGNAYQNKITDSINGPDPISIVDFRGTLPCDLVDIEGVREWESKQTLVYSTNVFKLNEENKNSESFRDGYEAVEPDWTEFQNMTYAEIINDHDAMNRFFNYKETYDNELLLTQETKFVTEGFRDIYQMTYWVNNNTIYTSFKEGKIEIAYKSFPIDSRGFPMIPDEDIYKKAVEMYLQERIDYKLWRQGKLNDAVYKKTEQDYHWAMMTCKSRFGVPTPDEMESIKNSYVRLITDMRSHSTGFANNSQRERIWRQ